MWASWTMSRQFRLAVTPADPVETLVEIDFGDRDGVPVPGVGEGQACVLGVRVGVQHGEGLRA